MASTHVHPSVSVAAVAAGAAAVPLTTNAWYRSDTEGEYQPPALPSAQSGQAAAYDADTGLIHIVGGAEGGSQTLHWEFDPTSGAMTSRAALPVGTSYLSAGFIGGTLYIAGGVATGTTLATFYSWNRGTNSWTDITAHPLPAARQRMAYCVAQGRIWIYGGRVSGGSAGTTTLYSSAGGAWTTHAAGSDLSEFGVMRASDDGTQLFVWTGGSGSAEKVTAFRFNVADPVTDAGTWTTLGSGALALTRRAAAMTGDVFRCFGGFDAASAVRDIHDHYDTTQAAPGSWASTDTDQPVGVRDAAYAVWPDGAGGHLAYVFGGHTGSAAQTLVQVYVPSTGGNKPTA